jgi:hypothetical protein
MGQMPVDVPASRPVVPPGGMWPELATRQLAANGQVMGYELSGIASIWLDFRLPSAKIER